MVSNLLSVAELMGIFGNKIFFVLCNTTNDTTVCFSKEKTLFSLVSFPEDTKNYISLGNKIISLRYHQVISFLKDITNNRSTTVWFHKEMTLFEISQSGFIP